MSPEPVRTRPLGGWLRSPRAHRPALVRRRAAPHPRRGPAQRDPADTAAVKGAFHAAIAVAQSQKTRSFELRTALGLAMLYRSANGDVESCVVLAPALEGFSRTTGISRDPVRGSAHSRTEAIIRKQKRAVSILAAKPRYHDTHGKRRDRSRCPAILLPPQLPSPHPRCRSEQRASRKLRPFPPRGFCRGRRGR
jgi:hypothetical protein